jgi:hypothetical protein
MVLANLGRGLNMGEFAIYENERVKIGTFDKMYYLRYEDRNKVNPIEGDVDPVKESRGLSFRLPMPSEDHLGPGGYGSGFVQSEPLEGFTEILNPSFQDFFGGSPGSLSISHPSGFTISNIPCHHGLKTPEIKGVDIYGSPGSHRAECFCLTGVKDTGEGVTPVVSCIYCNMSWTVDWAAVLPFIQNAELYQRLAVHCEDNEGANHGDNH